MEKISNIVTEQLYLSGLLNRIPNFEQEVIHSILKGVESWIKEYASDEIDNRINNNNDDIIKSIQTWMVENFAPIIQEWIINEYSPVVEEWIKSDKTVSLKNYINKNLEINNEDNNK